MIEMHLRAADLAETTFTISPMQETVFSLWVWRRPGRQPMHLPWRSAELAAWRQLDTDVLEALVAPTMWLPDFLTPRGSELHAAFDDELAAVGATPPRRVAADIRRTYGDATPPPVLLGRPSQVLRRITGAIADYWQACLQPYWPRIRAVLEADVVYRSRQLAASGAAGLFGTLDARVRWNDGILTVDRKIAERSYLEVAGRGVRLSPSLFCRGAVTYIDLDEPPWIVYPGAWAGDGLGEAESARPPRGGRVARAPPRRPAHPARRAHDDHRAGTTDRGHAVGRQPAPAGAPRRRVGQPRTVGSFSAVPAQRTRRPALRPELAARPAGTRRTDPPHGAVARAGCGLPWFADPGRDT